MTAITPIFVIGPNRSGTKWLSNILANHPDVAAIQSERAGGILETNMFHALRIKFPDLRRFEEYAGLIELWAATDFFKIAGADRRTFYDLRPRPTSHFELFRILMDDYARRAGRRHWLQKTDAWHAADLPDHFPGARFVVVERAMPETLLSTFLMETGGRGALPARMILRHVLQTKLLDRFRSRTGALATTYERIRDAGPIEIERICAALGLSYRPDMLNVPFRRNTSFRTEEVRRFSFKARDRLKMRCIGLLARLMPRDLLLALRGALAARDDRITSGSFGLVREETESR